ncbi:MULTISPECIES: hypothetical protein [Yersiniaceae]|jgi:hypothetical protein|nr:hypothetical protein [Rahnella sp. Larv3_ips]
MSLDFVLVKATGVVNSIGELEQDSSFARSNYKAYAEQLFPGLIWQADDTAIVGGAGIFIEVSLSDVTLHLSLRGRGDIQTAISKIAIEAAMAGIVVIDVQMSDILAVEALRASDYLSWYRSIFEVNSL